MGGPASSLKDILGKEVVSGKDLQGILEWFKEMVGAVGMFERGTKWDGISQKEE